MRYLDILTDPVVAGPHRRVQGLALAMLSLGHRPLLILPVGIDESFLVELESAGIAHRVIQGLSQLRKPSLGSIGHNITWLRGCASVFRRDLAPDGDQKPDFYVLNGIVNGHLARHRDLRGLPGIVIINDTILPRPAFRALAAALPATLTRIYQTPSVKRYYSGSDVCSFADHDVMPAGVDLRVFRRDAVRDFQAVTNRGTVQLGSLCNISARKGVDDAIEATYLVARRMPAFDFVYTVTGQRLATQHDYTQRLVELAGTSPSNCKVEFAAPVDQAGAASFLRSLDLLLVASKSESFPQSVIQAQAVGTPVIGYDIPGVNDQIMDGETGFLVAPGDVEQLAGRIYDAIKAPAELEAVAAAARRRVEAEFTLERNVKDFIAISERASAHHPTGAAVQAGSG